MLAPEGMQGWSFLTLVLAALAIGAPLAHALEMPVRRTYDAALWVAVTHTLYFYFGTVGGAIEVAAVIATVAWAVLVARWRPAPVAARGWALAGAGCLLLAHALFWLLVEPMNREFATWTPEAVPPDWTRFRDQWEFTHATRAALFFLGFCVVLASVFRARFPPPHREAEDAPAPLVAARGRGETTG
jgi:hypothetical protein